MILVRNEAIELTLNIVTDGLGANNDPIVQNTDFAPSRTLALRGETAKVHHLTILKDLDKGGARELADDTKLAAVGGSPAPGGGSSAFGTTHVGVADEVVEVHLVSC